MVPSEHRICARWLELGTGAGFAIVLASFAIYMLGLLEPLVPVQALVQLWRLPVDLYVAASGAPTGWGWLRMLGKGDYLNLLGIALFAAIIMACYLRLIRAFWQDGRRLQAIFALLQVLVLLAAASGLIG